MVEYTFPLDSVFHSLSDPVRRDILHRISSCELSVGELASKYDVSLAAISRHIKVLQQANLVRKRKEGKKHMVGLVPGTLREADEYLEQYRMLWQSRFNKLEAVLLEEE